MSEIMFYLESMTWIIHFVSINFSFQKDFLCDMFYYLYKRMYVYYIE